MKKIIISIKRKFFFIAIFLYALPAFSQQVSVFIDPPPYNSLPIESIWKINLINNTPDVLRVYLKGELSEQSAGVIAKGKTSVFELKPGPNRVRPKDLQPIDIQYVSNDPKYSESAIRQGTLPMGDYKICVSAFLSSDNSEAGTECIIHIVSQDAELKNISPVNGDSVSIQNPLNFVWLVTGANPQDLNMRIKIVEIQGEQSPEIALKENNAVFEKNVGNKLSFILTNAKNYLQDGKAYAWGIIIKQVNGDRYGEASAFTTGRSSFCMLAWMAVISQGPPTFYCQGQPLSFSYAVVLSGSITGVVSNTVTGPGGVIPSSISGNSISFTPPLPGQYHIEVKLTVSCSPNVRTLTKTITVRPSYTTSFTLPQTCVRKGSGPFSITGFNQTVPPGYGGCDINFSGTGVSQVPGTSYDDYAFQFNPDDPAVIAPGTYTITGTPDCPCAPAQSVTITVLPAGTPTYTINASATQLCQPGSVSLNVANISTSAPGFSYQWYQYTGTSCPPTTGTPGAGWNLVSGATGAAFVTNILTVGTHCFTCVISDPCGGVATATAVTVVVLPSVSSFSITSNQNGFCTNVPGPYPLTLTTDNPAGTTIVWTTYPQTTVTPSGNASINQTTTFTATIGGGTCPAVTQTITIPVTDPPPAGIICAQPHIIPGVLPECVPTTPACPINYIYLCENCDATMTLMKADGTPYPIQDYQISWSYFTYPAGQDVNYETFNLNNLSASGNGVPTTWTNLGNGIDNYFWNTNPLSNTTWYKSSITAPGNCPTVEVYAIAFVIQQVTLDDLVPVNLNSPYPCGSTINGQLTYSGPRPEGFQLSYEWYRNGSPISGPVLNTWPPAPINVTQDGRYALVVKNECTTGGVVRYLDVYYENFNVDYALSSCCVCRGGSLTITSNDSDPNIVYTWTANTPVTVTPAGTNGQFTVSNIQSNTIITLTAVRGNCPPDEDAIAIVVCP